MPRQQRAQYVDDFAHQADFNEQLYLALKQAPWWMISIAIHVIVFVIASLLIEREPSKEPPRRWRSRPTTPSRTKSSRRSTRTPKRSTPSTRSSPSRDQERGDRRPHRDDNDLPYSESLGEDGISDAPFTGTGQQRPDRPGWRRRRCLPWRGGRRDLGSGGGGKRTQGAVEDALEWLAAHQSPDGGWEAAGFDSWCDDEPVARGPTAWARRSTIRASPGSRSARSSAPATRTAATTRSPRSWPRGCATSSTSRTPRAASARARRQQLHLQPRAGARSRWSRPTA